MINLNKKVLPKYIYRLNVALVSFFAFWFTVCVAVMVAIGCIYGESPITYGTMIGGFAIFFIGLAVFFFVEKRLHKRYVNEVAAELEKTFFDMPYEEAERILKERGVITDNSFVSDEGDVFGKRIAPFDQVWFDFNFSVVGVCADFKVAVLKESEVYATYDLDCAMFNFLKGKDTVFPKGDLFELLVKNKREFAKEILCSNKIFHGKAY